MSETTMRAAVLHGIKDLRIDNVPAPGPPSPGQVKVRIQRVGICGSDVHYWEYGRIGDFVVRDPMILGHECAGEVVELGQGVTDLAVGDRVCLEPGVPRLSNAISHYYMKRGEYNLCPDIFFFATPPDHGAFCDYVNHPSDFCFKLPVSVSLDEGAFVEPLSTGIYASRVAPVTPGATVAITGAGPIGLVNLLAARAAGAAQVIVSDVVTERLAMACQLGACRVIQGGAEELRNATLSLTDGRGADVCIEAAGHPAALQACIGAVRAGGVVVLIGMPPEDTAQINVNDLIVREVRLRPIFRYNNTFATGVQLLASGKVDVMPLISKRFRLSETPEAFEYVAANRSACIKALVEID